MSVSRTYPHDLASVRAARSFVAEELADLGPGIDAVVLMVSELATNSIRHSESPFRVTIDRSGNDVCVEVFDDGPGQPVRRAPTIDMPSGRGLQIVEGLAEAWGVRHHDHGKTVWFTVSLASRS